MKNIRKSAAVTLLGVLGTPVALALGAHAAAADSFDRTDVCTEIASHGLVPPTQNKDSDVAHYDLFQDGYCDDNQISPDLQMSGDELHHHHEIIDQYFEKHADNSGDTARSKEKQADNQTNPATPTPDTPPGPEPTDPQCDNPPCDSAPVTPNPDGTDGPTGPAYHHVDEYQQMPTDDGGGPVGPASRFGSKYQQPTVDGSAASGGGALAHNGTGQ